MEGHIVETTAFHAEAAAKRLDFGLHRPAEGVGIAVEKKRRRSAFRQKFFQFPVGGAPADHQAAADGGEIFFEGSETTAEKGLSGRAGPKVTAAPIA